MKSNWVSQEKKRVRNVFAEQNEMRRQQMERNLKRRENALRAKEEENEFNPIAIPNPWLASASVQANTIPIRRLFTTPDQSTAATAATPFSFSFSTGPVQAAQEAPQSEANIARIAAERGFTVEEYKRRVEERKARKKEQENKMRQNDEERRRIAFIANQERHRAFFRNGPPPRPTQGHYDMSYPQPPPFGNYKEPASIVRSMGIGRFPTPAEKNAYLATIPIETPLQSNLHVRAALKWNKKPVPSVLDTEGKDFEYEYNCTICSEPLIKDIVVVDDGTKKEGRVTCGHKFHGTCLTDFISRKSSVPVCPVCEGIIKELHPSPQPTEGGKTQRKTQRKTKNKKQGKTQRIAQKKRRAK